jgi:hypothetical protein
MILEAKSLLGVSNGEKDLGGVGVMMALAVLRNGFPKMMGALSSPPVSITMKSTHRAECPTPTRTFSRIPLG